MGQVGDVLSARSAVHCELSHSGFIVLTWLGTCTGEHSVGLPRLASPTCGLLKCVLAVRDKMRVKATSCLPTLLNVTQAGFPKVSFLSFSSPCCLISQLLRADQLSE